MLLTYTGREEPTGGFGGRGRRSCGDRHPLRHWWLWRQRRRSCGDRHPLRHRWLWRAEETALKWLPPPPPPVTSVPEQTKLRKPPPPLPPVASAPEDAEWRRSRRGPQPRMEHCRLYFGALQKAIGGFVSSLCCGQPPEQFISHSKLVIMVGQRLVNTLYKEARGTDAHQSLLCKSNHLCALLKQLAVATKKAALHFPDKQALQEAQDFAKELAQRAQHFRSSLEL